MSVSRFPIEAGHVLTFARAIGDTAYSDERFAADGFSGAVAPPTFVQASAQFDPDYPLRPRPDAPWMGSPAPTPIDAVEAEVAIPDSGSQVLHAEQSYEFVRPVRVGDVLTATTRDGKTWEKDGRRGGRMVFGELITEYRDAAGDLVVTATAVTVSTARVPGGEA